MLTIATGDEAAQHALRVGKILRGLVLNAMNDNRFGPGVVEQLRSLETMYLGPDAPPSLHRLDYRGLPDMENGDIGEGNRSLYYAWVTLLARFSIIPHHHEDPAMEDRLIKCLHSAQGCYHQGFRVRLGRDAEKSPDRILAENFVLCAIADVHYAWRRYPEAATDYAMAALGFQTVELPSLATLLHWKSDYAYLAARDSVAAGTELSYGGFVETARGLVPPAAVAAAAGSGGGGGKLIHLADHRRGGPTPRSVSSASIFCGAPVGMGVPGSLAFVGAPMLPAIAPIATL